MRFSLFARSVNRKSPFLSQYGDQNYQMKYLLILTLLLSITQAQKFKYREFKNVENFYSSITKDVIELSIKYKTPPAVILAIAGLESGYGSGYISQITGNLLSLGANKNDTQLPALNLPYCQNDKTKKTLFDPLEQKKCTELIWKQRPKSLKKDYRPEGIAGSKKNLEYFKYHPAKLKQANKDAVEDFVTVWINKNHKYAPFRDARIWLDKKIEKEGIDTLFTKTTNMKFASLIGGRNNSFNYRETWPKKVKYILTKTGLTELCASIYYEKKSFLQAWKNTSNGTNIASK